MMYCKELDLLKPLLQEYSRVDFSGTYVCEEKAKNNSVSPFISQNELSLPA